MRWDLSGVSNYICRNLTGSKGEKIPERRNSTSSAWWGVMYMECLKKGREVCFIWSNGVSGKMIGIEAKKEL